MKKIFSTLFVLFAGMTAFAQTLSVDDVVIENKSASVTFNINIADASSCIAAGMVCEVPEGMKIENITRGNIYSYNEEEESYSHSVSKQSHADNAMKFLVVSMNNDFFDKAEGVLVKVKVNASGVEDGSYTGYLKSIELSRKGTEGEDGLYNLPDLAFNILVGAPDAIEAINAENTQISEVYSVSGALQNGLQKGVNIVKYANGEVKKVIVK